MSGPVNRSLSGRRYTRVDAERAALLLGWLASKRLKVIAVRKVCQYGPPALRRASIAKAALALLADFGYIDAYDVDRRVWDW